ncbi:MAG: hypothetical protein P9F75_06240 [Candidatus Contendobacter sp.]|nr:hypothetical protein [Candidatus Contendobacter sp.]
MRTKRRFTTTLLSLGLAAGLAGGSMAQAAETAPPAAKPAESQPAQSATPAKQEWRIPTGEHWSKATDTERRAYLLGILNMAMVEYQLTGPNPKHRTTVPRLVKALDGMAVPQIVETVDAYYKANPDKQQQPIIEVIWFQMVVPKTGPAKIK